MRKLFLGAGLFITRGAFSGAFALDLHFGKTVGETPITDITVAVRRPCLGQLSGARPPE